MRKLLTLSPSSLLAKAENKTYTIPRKAVKDVCIPHQDKLDKKECKNVCKFITLSEVFEKYQNNQDNSWSRPDPFQRSLPKPFCDSVILHQSVNVSCLSSLANLRTYFLLFHISWAVLVPPCWQPQTFFFSCVPLQIQKNPYLYTQNNNPPPSKKLSVSMQLMGIIRYKSGKNDLFFVFLCLNLKKAHT